MKKRRILEIRNLSNMSSKNKSSSSTQHYLSIAEIKDDVIVTKGGGLRAALMVSSINFDLKSQKEQDAIIYSYQDFLNSLDFEIQILITSRKLNINNYLEMLRQRAKEHTNELLRLQTEEYVNYIQELVQLSNIMSKIFYIIIPFSPVEAKQGFFNKIQAAFKPQEVVKHNRDEFQKYKSQLWQRVNHVMMSLHGAGIYMAPLNTQELIELFYNTYNPDVVLKNGLANTGELNLET